MKNYNINTMEENNNEEIPTFEEILSNVNLFEKINDVTENNQDAVRHEKETYNEMEGEIINLNENSKIDVINCSETNEIFSDCGDYILQVGGKESGYYLNKITGRAQISNFYVVLTKWVKTVRDGEPLSYYEGDVNINDGTSMRIDRISASTLEDPSGFKKFIGNLCGMKAHIKGSPNDVVKAVKAFNKEVKMFEEREFGYNDKLDTFYTEDLVIRAKEINETKTPIKYSENWNSGKLFFKLASKEEVDAVKQTIIDKFMLWDDPKIMYNILAFGFFPVIYPYLKNKNPNKFYIMLKGPSGSGKSEMSKWIQNFYGIFQSLFTWTSTDTSINITGCAFKDAVFIVDDLKSQNFRTENDVKKVMGVLQNYSDCTGRQRANVDLKLREERFIKGHLLISAEDLVISESSTIARGIIIDVNSKQVRTNELWEISEASKRFSVIMPYFIQYLFKNYYKEKTEKIFEESHRFISTHPLIDDPNIPADNLPRIINNFAALRTSWLVMSEFLFQEKSEFDKIDYQNTFDQNLISLMLDNIERISSYKPDIVFENMLWEMLDNGTFSLRRILHSGEIETPAYTDRGKVVGYYTQDPLKNITLVIQLSTALREMKRMVENFATSEDTLKTKLQRDKKIKVNPSKKISLFGRKISGVQWIGNYPKSIFGLKEDADPVEQATEILANTVTEDEDVLF